MARAHRPARPKVKKPPHPKAVHPHKVKTAHTHAFRAKVSKIERGKRKGGTTMFGG